MPTQIVNPDISANNWSNNSATFNYDYPNKLDLKPGSRLHQFLVSKLMNYARESARIMSRRYKSWNDMDEKLMGYIPTSDKEKLIKEKDSRKPVSIVFPYSYAILETLVSYNCAAFLPDPMFRYEGEGPEDVAGAFLMEKLISLHCNRNKIALNLHTMFRDAGAYGFGAVSPQWVTKYGKKITKKPIGYANADGAIIPTGTERVVEDAVLFEGNSLVNIDPYLYLPDPSVPIHDPQAGEFVGWVDSTNYMNLLEEEQNDDDMFNVKYLKLANNKTTTIFGPTVMPSAGKRNSYRNWEQGISRQAVDPIDLLHIYVKLVPRQWNLGNSTYPEKYLFTVGGDSVILRAKPLGLHHNLFPVTVSAPDFDGYSPVAYSRLEILQGMQTTVDWLFNSHIANVRKAINDVLIVDPFLVNINDLKDPDAGWLVRLRRPAWGKGVENAVKQLNITDITKSNMTDVSLIINYMQQMAGTDNPIMGNLRQGGPERLTSAEFKGTAQGAVNRLERIAKIIGIQAMQDIGYMFAYHAQQLMSQEVWLKSSGNWPETVTKQFALQNNRVLVTPDDIIIDYDLLVKDGSIPGGNFSSAWIDIYKIIVENPLIAQQMDTFRLFEFIATSLGAKNIDTFRAQPQQASLQTMPDEQVSAQVQAGNLVPLSGALNGTR